MTLRPATAAFEQAARIACGKIGVDPDTQIEVPDQVFAGVTKTVPRWVSVADQMVNLAVLMTSMQEAAMTGLAVNALMDKMRRG